MQRSLPQIATILALFLTVPILCLAWTTAPASREFDEGPRLGDSALNRGGARSHDGPATAINAPVDAKMAPVASKPEPLYLPNVAREQKDSQTPQTGLAKLFSFLRPSKGDLERYFKGEDDGFRDRGRSASDPFKKRDWK
jgi:hypothetical protein